MDELYKALQTAWDDLAVAHMTELLVEIAERCIDLGETSTAADILALLLHYPLRADLRAQAEMLFCDLEATLCPRVIWDARENAHHMTLDDLIVRLLAKAE